ncbi:uncharacterized protein C2845_PM17G14860 [Panicum miliaceum]|uniref:ARM repeat superfamily protein n=1 Tax=Panicum miliaceum TaxID=4540 RepID=A0A3L6Q2X1_PANMI|nr:uncharacterized protein C2845_PM17G14860 [Panicum miliaceum]
MDPCSPYLISTANWVIGQLAICLPEVALLFKLLGTIVEGGQEKVLPHIPEIVSNIANTVMKLLPPVPDPWPQENSCSSLPPPSCVNDASVLLEFVMRSVTCMEEAARMKVFELVPIWADTIANWDSWEEMDDQGVFNTIKEAINFHQRFDLTGFFLKMLPSQSENGSQSSVIGRVSNFVTRAIAAYPSATWRACSCIHTLLHAPNFSLVTEDARKAIVVFFAQATFSRFKSISDSPAGIWKPLLLAISSCYICYPDAIEQVLNNYDGNGYTIWASALAQVSSSSFSPGLSSESEIKLAVLTLSTVIERLLVLSMGGTKVLQDCYDSEDDDVREETEEEFLERYALAAAGESIEVVEEGDLDEETEDIELGSLDEVDIQQVVLSLMQKQPALQAQTLPDGLVERIAETFPEYEHLCHVRRQS